MIGRLFLVPILIAVGAAGQLEDAIAQSNKKHISVRSLEDLITPRRPLDKSRLGINAFANDPRFGSIRSQFREVRSTLGLRHVRMLFAWNDQVQPTPGSSPFFGFYDELARSLAPGQKAIVVLTGLPSWMRDSRNWIAGDPRRTYVEKWILPVVSRYRSNSKIAGWQFWNEPNDENNADNVTMDFVGEPDNYIDFFARASTASKNISPRKRVITAATTAIAQNYDETFQYNKDLVAGGILSMTDIFAVHFYGKSIELLLIPGGIGDFLKSLSRPVWITESGAQGVLKQRDYAQRIFPYLFKNFPQIKRVYIYQFTEDSDPATSYGLRTTSRRNPVSDLYTYLRDGK